MQCIAATVVPGHRVASGQNGDPRFPGGTLAMQRPHFRERGLDLAIYHPGTLNLCIAPFCYQVIRPRLTFRQLQWHPVEPAEDFSFFDCRIHFSGAEYPGLIYYPHPETKPEHFQAADVLEVLAPTILGLVYGTTIHLCVDGAQMCWRETQLAFR